jgi:hypothetical protein
MAKLLTSVHTASKLPSAGQRAIVEIRITHNGAASAATPMSTAIFQRIAHFLALEHGSYCLLHTLHGTHA